VSDGKRFDQIDAIHGITSSPTLRAPEVCPVVRVLFEAANWVGQARGRKPTRRGANVNLAWKRPSKNAFSDQLDYQNPFLTWIA
jgi:hypothetical protein